MLLQPAQVPVHGVGHSAATLFLLKKELAKGNIRHLPNSAISFKLPLDEVVPCAKYSSPVEIWRARNQQLHQSSGQAGLSQVIYGQAQAWMEHCLEQCYSNILVLVLLGSTMLAGRPCWFWDLCS